MRSATIPARPFLLTSREAALVGIIAVRSLGLEVPARPLGESRLRMNQIGSSSASNASPSSGKALVRTRSSPSSSRNLAIASALAPFSNRDTLELTTIAPAERPATMGTAIPRTGIRTAYIEGPFATGHAPSSGSTCRTVRAIGTFTYRYALSSVDVSTLQVVSDRVVGCTGAPPMSLRPYASILFSKPRRVKTMSFQNETIPSQ